MNAWRRQTLGHAMGLRSPESLARRGIRRVCRVSPISNDTRLPEVRRASQAMPAGVAYPTAIGRSLLGWSLRYCSIREDADMPYQLSSRGANIMVPAGETLGLGDRSR